MIPYVGISLTKGQTGFYDLEDADKVKQYNWYAAWNRITKSYYIQANIRRNKGRTVVQMSRLIMGLNFGDKRKVDHKDHNTLDNRKKNLRIVTNSQNMQNMRRVKGYSWNKKYKKWEAYIKVNYKLIRLGYFDIENDASQAYLNARKIHGFIQ